MIKKITKKIISIIKENRRAYFPTIHQKNLKIYKNNRYKQERTTYDLDNNSTVFDIGGYEGDWSDEIICKYNSNIFIFEPIPNYYINIKNRFKDNSKVKIFNFGLSNKQGKEKFSLNENASSAHKKSKNSIEVELKKISSFIKNNNIKKIDLMKMNIEGAEYDLIQDLIDNNLINKIDNIQIQFHDFIPHAKEKMNEIQKELNKTHKITYQYEFVWENWKKINNN